jgi:hypothetical protein
VILRAVIVKLRCQNPLSCQHLPIRLDLIVSLSCIRRGTMVALYGDHENQIGIHRYSQSPNVRGRVDYDKRAAASRRFS